MFITVIKSQIRPRPLLFSSQYPKFPLPKDFPWPCGSVSHLDSLVITAASSEAREEHPEITTACCKCQLSLIFWTRLQFTYEHIASPVYLGMNKGGDHLVFKKSTPPPRRLYPTPHLGPAIVKTYYAFEIFCHLSFNTHLTLMSTLRWFRSNGSSLPDSGWFWIFSFPLLICCVTERRTVLGFVHHRSPNND